MVGEYRPENYPHFNRLRSVTVSSQTAEGVTIGDAVDFLEKKAKEILPVGYSYAWDGESRSFVEGASDTSKLFALALLFTFLILAAQFESWIHPLTISPGWCWPSPAESRCFIARVFGDQR